MGFLLKLNVLKINGEGAWERLNSLMLRSSEQVFYNGRFLGRSEEDIADITCPYLCCFHTYSFVGILGMLCVRFIYC
jgi:hypothetical protein